MSVDHYENFPVASLLCPAHLRPAVKAIYAYARTADDLADEGSATPEQRLQDLAAFGADLAATAAGQPASPRWHKVFAELKPVLDHHTLPLPLLQDLLSAFRQDVVQHQYTDRQQLLDYCRRSANPVGRLMLHLYGVNGSDALAQSDDICSALQLANFWQDFSVDTTRGRLYVPRADLQRHAVDVQTLQTEPAAPAARAVFAELSAWTRAMMLRGAPLVHRLPARAGWELRLVVQGGLRILDRIDAMALTPLAGRPTLGPRDAPVLLWRAAGMRAPSKLATPATP